MAKRTIVLLTDDITGEEAENVDSYTFKVPNFVIDEESGEMDVVYERVSFDATPETAKQFLTDLRKGIQRKYLDKDAVIVKAVQTSDGSGNVETEASDMRDFARSEQGKALGLKVNERGRVSADVQEAYRKAVANGDWPPFGSKKNGETDSETPDSE